MSLVTMGGFQSGLQTSEFDTTNVGTGATLTGNTNGPHSYTLQASTGSSSVVSYGEIGWTNVGLDGGSFMFKVMFPAVPTAITALVALCDGSGNQLWSLRINASGFWQINSNANSTVYTSTTRKPIPNYWHLIEVYYYTHPTMGKIQVNIDHTADADLSATSLNTGTTTQQKLRLGVVEAQANAPVRYFDTWVVASGYGIGDLGNTYVIRRPLVATDLGNWTVDTAGKADWEVLNEIPFVGSPGSGWIKSSTPSQEDRMLMPSFGASGTGLTVLGVLPVVRARRAGAGAAGFSMMMYCSGIAGVSIDLDPGSTAWKTMRGLAQNCRMTNGAALDLTELNSMSLRFVHDSGSNEVDICAAFVYLAYRTTAGAIAPVYKMGVTPVGRPSRSGKIVSLLGAVKSAGRAAGNWMGRGRMGHKVT